ncbi:MAG: HEAT repeat domain-containing protein [Bradymonadia bacterium]
MTTVPAPIAHVRHLLDTEAPTLTLVNALEELPKLLKGDQHAASRALFIEVLKHPHWQLRSAAARQLGHLGPDDPTGAEPLGAGRAALWHNAMHDDVPWSRSAARWALRTRIQVLATDPQSTAQSDQFTEAVVESLTTADSTTKRRALALMVSLDLQVHPDRLAPALTDPDWAVRAAAIDALSPHRLASPALSHVLLDALHDTAPGVREAAAATAATFYSRGMPLDDNIAAQLARQTDDEDGAARQGALEALACCKQTQAVELRLQMGIKALGDDHSRVRGQGAALLARLGTEAAPALDDLIAHLDDPAESVRLTVHDTLQQLGRDDQHTQQRLWKALEAPRAHQRVAALKLLKDLHTKGPVPLKGADLEGLLHQPSGQLWQAAMWLINWAPLSSADTAEVLVRGARNPDPTIRTRSLKAMLERQGDLSATQLTPTLLWSLRDTSRQARKHSVGLVERLLRHSATHAHALTLWPQLIRRLADLEPRVNRAAFSVFNAHFQTLSPWLGNPGPYAQAVWVCLRIHLMQPGHDLHRQSRYLERVHGHISWYGQLIQRREAHHGRPDPFETHPPPSMPHDVIQASEEAIRLAELFGDLGHRKSGHWMKAREGAWLAAAWVQARG